MRRLLAMALLFTAQAGWAATDYITFSLNVQDFSYPEESAALVRKIVDLHERHAVPVDVFLTTDMVDHFTARDPGLLPRLRSSPLVAVSYHFRPPKPYYDRYDWLGLRSMTEEQQAATIRAYETHGVDPVTGQPTSAPGGFGNLASVLGRTPSIAGMIADESVAPVVSRVFQELGARMTLVHGHAVNLGDTRAGLYLKPEHVDLKLFEHLGESPSAVLEAALEESHRAEGARAPYFVGVKMHDNDFFAERSAWLTVYSGDDRTPPWDVTRKAAPLPQPQRDAMWALYEETVAYAASIRERAVPVNAPMIMELLAGPPSNSGVLHLSATMHIETNRNTWPNPDALLQYLSRATAAGGGMRWSIGADIGWLQGEPRAAEVVTKAEALGVQWDVHAHEHADRPRVHAALTRFGGHPTGVASGLLVSEIDALKRPVTSDGVTWQAAAVWGIALRPLHGDGADDRSYGLWRPKSSAEYTVHDPAGTLIAVGGGAVTMAGAEAFAAALKTATALPPVLSASIMVSPSTLTAVGGGDLAALEAWAARMAANPAVRWATIAETAAAWQAAGGVPSRTETIPSALPATSFWIVPAAARAPGAGGAVYTTSLTVANTGTADTTFTLKSLGHDTDGRAGAETSFALGAGRCVTYADVLGSVFGVAEGYGALRIGSSSASLAVSAQTSTGSDGSFGQSVPGFGASEWVSGAGPRTLLSVREDAAFRTNLVLANATEAPLEVDVTLVSEGGSVLAARRVALPPLGMTQLTQVVRQLGVTGNVTGARLVVATPTPGGAFAAYASAIDNLTNDPRTLLPR